MTHNPSDTAPVLVVDTNADSLVAIGKALTSLGYDGLPAPDVATARKMAVRSGKLAMAVACDDLPDGSGVELLKELKRDYGCSTAVLSDTDPPDDGCSVGVDLWLDARADHAELLLALRALGRMNGGAT